MKNINLYIAILYGTSLYGIYKHHKNHWWFIITVQYLKKLSIHFKCTWRWKSPTIKSSRLVVVDGLYTVLRSLFMNDIVDPGKVTCYCGEVSVARVNIRGVNWHRQALLTHHRQWMSIFVMTRSIMTAFSDSVFTIYWYWLT